jgi:hypothetical protein
MHAHVAGAGRGLAKKIILSSSILHRAMAYGINSFSGTNRVGYVSARGRNQTDFCGYRGKKNIFYPVNEYGEIGILKGDGYGTL